MRQNIRTAYNYLDKNNISFSFEILKGADIKKNDLKRIMDIYFKRRNSHNGADSYLHQFYLKHFHYYTVAQRALNNSYVGVLRMGGEIVAFWSGFSNWHGDYISCPRLSINEKYSRYSPGIILLCETAKVLKDMTGIPTLDLSRGAHSYKIRMGGIKYYSHDFAFE